YHEQKSGRTLELDDVAVDAREPHFGAPVPVSFRARFATRDVELQGIVSEGVVDLTGDRPTYRGSVRAGPGTFGELTLDRLTAEVHATPPVLDIESGTAETLGGRVTGSAHLNAESGLSGTLEARGLDL